MESYCQPPYSTDFLVKCGRMTIVVECHANVMRDLTKTVACAKLVKEAMRGDFAIVAVPYFGDSNGGNPGIEELDVEVVISMLASRIKEASGVARGASDGG